MPETILHPDPSGEGLTRRHTLTLLLGGAATAVAGTLRRSSGETQPEQPRPVLVEQGPSRQATLEEEVERALAGMVHGEVSQFAIALAGARAMWKEHRALVESDAWEPHLVEAFMTEAGHHPSEEEAPDIPNVEALRREFLPTAEAWARESMRRASGAAR